MKKRLQSFLIVSQSHEDREAHLRFMAIIKNMYSLDHKFRKKKRSLRLYRIVIFILCLLIVGSVSYYYLIMNESGVHQDTTVIKQIPEFYTVSFLNSKNIPLAQFESLGTAQDFCLRFNDICKVKLKIYKDSIRLLRPSFQEEINYSAQLGAYNEKFLNEYEDKFIYLEYYNEGGYHKYRVEPFSSLETANKFLEQNKISNKYILKY